MPSRSGRRRSTNARALRLQKLYPVSKWGFVSQVQGGFTSDGTCVVTARAVLVPRVLGSRLVFRPQRSAMAFATKAGATQVECREVAALKLKEAIVGGAFGLARRSLTPAA